MKKEINGMTMRELLNEECSIGSGMWECEQAGEKRDQSLMNYYRKIGDRINELKNRNRIN